MAGRRWSTLVVAGAVVLLFAAPTVVTAQETGPRPPQWTLLGGVGNAMGWVGVQAERHLVDGRTSVFGGAGYTPELDRGWPTGPAAAAGIRGFVGQVHRAFLELSFTQVLAKKLANRRTRVVEPIRTYGPGLQLGFQYVSPEGVTVLASGGIGYPVGLDDDLRAGVQLMGGLGMGYSWR